MTEKYYGNVQSSDDASAYNELVFQINAIMKRVNTCMPVQVTAVKAGGLGPVGFVARSSESSEYPELRNSE